MPAISTPKLAVDWLICHLRWPWLAIALLITYFTVPPDQGDKLTLAYSVIGVGALYNAMILALLFIGWYPSWMSTTAAIFDTFLAVILISLTGGFASSQMPVLLFVVITVSLRINSEAGLLSATPMVLAFAVSLILSNTTGPDDLIKTSIKAMTLFVAAGVAGYVGLKQLQSTSVDNQTEIKRLRIANERAKAIYEMANTLSSTLNYRKVLRAMVDLAYMALSEVDKKQNGTSVKFDRGAVGMVLLFEGKGRTDKLKMVAGRNAPRIDEGTTVPVEQGVLAQAIYKAEAIISSDPQNDPSLKKFASLQQTRSLVCAPLRAGFDTYGLVLFASPQPNFYTAEHASLLVTFCNQAIIALQNAQLYADLELEQKKLLEKEAQARRELARSLHDGPTQAVASIAMRLDFVQMVLKREGDIQKALEEITLIEEIAQRTTKEIRNMLFTLRPVVLETQGLAAAIHQYAERLRDLDAFGIEVDTDEYDGQLSTEEEGVIFAIIEEAVSNAKKHGKAELVQIKLDIKDNCVVAEVRDNGTGFDVSSVQDTYDQRGSLGLLNMSERARMIGGHCHLSSTAGKGTMVRVEVPLEKHRTPI